MVHPLYFILGLMLAIMLFIMGRDYAAVSKNKNVDRSYHKLLRWTVYFCLQDMTWGVFASGLIYNIHGFKIIASLFHLSAAMTVFVWIDYLITYMELRRNIMIRILVGILVLIQYVMIFINLKIPFIFDISQDNYYHTLYGRIFLYSIQGGMYFIAMLVPLWGSLHTTGKLRKKNFSLAGFFAIPIIFGIFQWAFADLPLYSIGYYMAVCIIHIFVISEDRTEMQLEKNAALNQILRAMTDEYLFIAQIDFDTGKERLYRAEKEFSEYYNVLNPETPYENRILEYADKHLSADYYELYLKAMQKDLIWDTICKQKSYSFHHLDSFNGSYRWYETRFVKVDNDTHRRIAVVCIRDIDDDIRSEQKRQEEDAIREANLIKISNTDELTGFLNRRAYEEDMARYADNNPKRNFIFISFDVNGLKIVNDTIGHAAGDELLRGAADCIRQCFGSYGSVYRIGGDEFVAFVFNGQKHLETFIKDFNQTMSEWKGEHVQRLSISYGCVTSSECKKLSIREIAELADQRMYEDKARHYEDLGVDRKAIQTAFKVLSQTYMKILRINLSDDSYVVIQMSNEDRETGKEYKKFFAEWIPAFARSGYVHEQDRSAFLVNLRLASIREHFDSGHRIYHFHYRQMMDGMINHVILEMMVSPNYSDELKEVFLFVKNLD